MKTLGREDLLAGLTLPTEWVPVPELNGGGFICIRGLTAFERGRYEQALIKGNGDPRSRIFDPAYGRGELLARTIVDSHGHRVFTDEDAAQLQELRADVADRLFAVAQRLSGLRPEDFDELKKLCGGDPTADSSTT